MTVIPFGNCENGAYVSFEIYKAIDDVFVILYFTQKLFKQASFIVDNCSAALFVVVVLEV